ncbi:MAG: hypothetical protein DRG39_03585, partial [Deltaproteobacteria bacterium]
MAGIGFELKRILKKGRLTSLILAVGYSTALSSGPWIISILAIIISAFLIYPFAKEKNIIMQFHISVTYTIAISLIISSPFQLLFTRYVADRHFEKRFEKILPNFLGVMSLSMIIGLVVSSFLAPFFSDSPPLYKISFISTIIILSGFWIATTLLTSFKSYKYIFLSFILGYGLVLVLIPWMSKYSISGLMFCFFLGQSAIFLMFLGRIIYEHPSDRGIEFEFLNKRYTYPSLAFIGFFYNAGIWIDKFIFWFSPLTGKQVIGPLRASIVYDIPIFLAYLAIAPGMGIFFLKLEGEFAESYERYYRAVTGRDSLFKIYILAVEMITSARTIILDVLRVQGIASIAIFLFEESFFNIFRLPLLYIPLFNVLMTGTFVQLVFLSVLGLLFYYDLRIYALYITMIFFALNAYLSYISVHLGPYFYGYGYTVSLIFSSVMGIIFLRRFLHEIHY